MSLWGTLSGEFQRTIGQILSLARVNDARNELKKLCAEFEHEKSMGRVDADAERAVRGAIARKGLEIQQALVPALNELGDECLEFAGGEAVRAVAAPIHRVGTDRDGKTLAPIDSGFIVPEKYREQPIVTKLKSVLTGR